MPITPGATIEAQDFKGPSATFPVITQTTGISQSLTTIADQRVLVIAKGIMKYNGSGGDVTVNLKYNGVTKDSQVSSNIDAANSDSFCLMYYEIPGAATVNVTVDFSTTGTSVLEGVRIITIKF